MNLNKNIVNIAFKVLARGLVSCSKIEEGIKEELEYYEDGFIIEFKVLNTESKVAVEVLNSQFRIINKKIYYEADISIIFKSYRGAGSVLLGKTAVYQAYSQHMFLVKGDFIKSMPFLRILYYVEAYLFPGFISANILKEVPKRSGSRFKAYLKMVF